MMKNWDDLTDEEKREREQQALARKLRNLGPETKQWLTKASLELAHLQGTVAALCDDSVSADWLDNLDELAQSVQVTISLAVEAEQAHYDRERENV